MTLNPQTIAAASPHAEGTSRRSPYVSYNVSSVGRAQNVAPYSALNCASSGQKIASGAAPIASASHTP
jgi:hypothetical protein